METAVVEQPMKVTLVRRVFTFEGKTYDDPNPIFSVERAKIFLANESASIANAKVLSDEIVGNRRIIELGKNAGTHG